MSKRLAIVLALCGAALVSVGWLWLHARPITYLGESLETWACRAYDGNAKGVEAIEAIGPRAVPELATMLKVNDSKLAKWLWVKQRSLPPEWRPLLQRFVKQPLSVESRGAAARALGILGPKAKAAVPSLGEALDDPAHQVAFDAAAALSHIGEPAVPALLAAIHPADTNRTRSIIYALSQIGPDAKAAIPTLTTLRQASDSNVRAAAEYALGCIRDPLLRSLYKLTRDADPRRREDAVQSLDDLGLTGPTVSNVLYRATRDKEPKVRIAAEQALKQVQSREQLASARSPEAALGQAQQPR